MKKSSASVSPFLLLLLPALLLIGFKTTTNTPLTAEKQQASTYFQLPALKGVIKVFCF